MSFRIENLYQLELCSPYVKKQLEKHMDAFAPGTPLQLRAAIKDRSADQPRRLNQPEQEAGRLLVAWIDLVVLPNGLRPGLFFAHVANAGVAGGEVRGGILQGQGVRKGWPDYILDLPAGGYHGFRLELKAAEGAKPTPEQLETLTRLESVGFKCAVAWGFDDAKRAVQQYLDLLQ